MAKDGRITRGLTLGLTSILTGMLLVNMNRDKVEARDNRNARSVDEDMNFNRKLNSAKISKVVVESDSFSIKKNNQEYDADPSLKMVGLSGIKNKKNNKSDFL